MIDGARHSSRLGVKIKCCMSRATAIIADLEVGGT
jgi:hypothetical protein